MDQASTVNARNIHVERATRLLFATYLLALVVAAVAELTGRFHLTIEAWGYLIIPAVGLAHNVWTLARSRRATDPLDRDRFFKEGAMGVVVTLIYLGSTLYIWMEAPAVFTGV
ncbi:hypothetical protein [Actinoplanes sp. NPDC049802]|uniref:hypothetical protein n=1 Tax=Actinoplanes sp. NPDC049802 TaxID=3154742 RepID=UPI0033F87927